jgi:hypothetical protein
MPPIPAQDLRSNLATWSVLAEFVPAVTRRMLDVLAAEQYDPAFAGQQLVTTYFDTYGRALRAARKAGERYLTLRVRHYQPGDTYALSVKTEMGKYRVEVPAWRAKKIIEYGFDEFHFDLLPSHLVARIYEHSDGELLQAVVDVRFRRYAVEDADNRLTLDLGIETDTGKCFPSEVLEHKATDPDASPYPVFPALGIRPIKLSKFLWATRA